MVGVWAGVVLRKGMHVWMYCMFGCVFVGLNPAPASEQMEGVDAVSVKRVSLSLG